MKLSQEIIFYHLEKKYSLRYLKKGNQNLSYKRPVFFDPQFNLSFSTILINPNKIDDLKRSLHLINNSLLLFIEEPDLTVKDFNFSQILIEDDLSIDIIFNELQELYNLYDQWDNQLKKISYNNGSFQNLIDSCELIMDHPILLVDQKFYYAAFSKSFKSNLDPNLVDEHFTMSIDAVNDFISDHKFQKLYEIRQTFIYEDITPKGIEKMLCKNFFDEEKYCGRLIILLISGDYLNLKLYLKAILEHLFTYIDKLFQKYHSFDLKKIALNSFRKPLLNILNHIKNPIDQWDRIALENGWNNYDRLQLIQFRSKASYTENIYSEFLGSKIENQWPGSIAMLYENHLILLINLDYFSRNSENDFYPQLPFFLRESLLIAGISRVFYDINDLRISYEHTQIALDFGISQTPTKWIHHFNDYALSSLLKNSTGHFEISQICDEKLLTLINYDTEKHTEYYHTLSTYFRCRLNASLTAKILHIHRSSLLSRLDRMKELFDINFESNEKLLYLGLSWLILERSQTFNLDS